MQTKISEKFWEDEHVAELPVEGKLAILWALTNSGVNLLGITEVTRRKFEFETGMPLEALWRACDALPESFVQHGEAVLAVNFIRYQLGSGPQLVTNMVFRSVKRAFDQLTVEPFREALLANVPELARPLASPSEPFQTGKPLASPSKGKEKSREGVEKEKAGKGSGEGGGSATSLLPSGPSTFAAAPTGEAKKNRRPVDLVLDSKRLDAIARELRGVNEAIDSLDQCFAEIPAELKAQKRALEAEKQELEAAA